MKISEFMDFLGLIQGEVGDVDVTIMGSDKYGYAMSGPPKGFERVPAYSNPTVPGHDRPEYVELFCEGHDL